MMMDLASLKIPCLSGNGANIVAVRDKYPDAPTLTISQYYLTIAANFCQNVDEWTKNATDGKARMSAMDQMRFGAVVMAAIFGGPGVFYCIESFTLPSLALTGIIYLAIALALICAAQWSEAKPAPRKLPPRKRR